MKKKLEEKKEEADENAKVHTLDVADDVYAARVIGLESSGPVTLLCLEPHYAMYHRHTCRHPA